MSLLTRAIALSLKSGTRQTEFQPMVEEEGSSYMVESFTIIIIIIITIIVIIIIFKIIIIIIFLY